MKIISLPLTVQIPLVSTIKDLQVVTKILSREIESRRNFDIYHINFDKNASRVRHLSMMGGKKGNSNGNSKFTFPSELKEEKKENLSHSKQDREDIKAKQENEEADSISKGGHSERRIEMLRSQTQTKHSPKASSRLKKSLIALILCLFFIIAARLIVTLVVNDRYSSFPPLMIAVGTRAASLGNLGKLFWNLLLTQNNSKSFYITTESQNRILAYSQNITSTQETDYSNFVLQQMQNEINSTASAELYIIRNTQSFDPDNLLLVEPNPLNLNYQLSPQLQIKYNATLNTALLVMLADIMDCMEKYTRGIAISPNNITEKFILNTTFSTIIYSVKNARYGILQECNKIEVIEQNYSIALISTISFIILVILIFLVTTLSIIQNQLVNMLKLLLEIGKAEVNSQLNETYSFLKTISLSRYTETNDIFQKEFEAEPENNNEVNEETNLKGKEQEVHTSSGIEKKRSFVSHTNSNWKILLVVVFFAGIIIGLYVAYDAITSISAKTIAIQTDHLYTLTRTLIFNYYTIGYGYQYIATNKTGFCGNNYCDIYMKSLLQQRFAELNELITGQQGNLTYMSSSYNQLFDNLILGNPCNSYFLNLSACNNLFGGIMTEGGYVANLRFVDLLGSLFSDFGLSKGQINDIQAYLNDIRFIDMEILNTLLITPAFQLLINTLLDDSQNIAQKNTISAGLFFLGFIVLLFLMSYFGGGWLFAYIRNSIYDTKTLLSSLPTGIIKSNSKILQFLEESVKSLE